MGKAPASRQKQRHDPLYKDLTTQGGNLRTKARGAKKTDREDEGEEFIDSTSSRKILQLAREQQDELEKEENKAARDQDNFTFGSRFVQEQDEDEEDDEEDYGNVSDFGSEGDFEEEEVEEIDAEDAAMFEEYLRQSQPSKNFGQDGSYNLADKIMASIREKEQEQKQKEQAVEKPKDAVLLPPKVIAAYTQIGQVLSTWTHGKLPKLFKVIPSLNNWQDVLYVTQPENWTPHVVYEATKLFVSNLQSKQAEKFVENVLLERFRSDIETNEDHSLNYHVYRALKKALYKPGAFFKGFLFPLVQEGVSVREATIAGSVLSKISIPSSHSSAALCYLVSLDFSPANTVFIRILIEKKYALPYRVIDDLVFYFMRFRIVNDNSMIDDEEEKKSKKEAPLLPVVWHKAFLAFAQTYKNDITEDQRDFLLETTRQRPHRDISPEIRRELLAGSGRTEENQKEEVMADVF
ncbi:Bystin [Wickerhamomyces ciferrii]|uniref:Bystin n=1 Tax=Wickerhamomyces ciferrii (strain ATCC 14091 / BCRC 22168 / CBS 111 / JCM 3599 / NBRC 0793 / NRRL Y-1031 F-60-10) TaxID=1206466 RepID=K0KS84_WICCF|nr:Bystin [Wickerhamomyces ciferrii]CCH46026.1 Bystin [Wickerhamomyces ciferrii]